MIRLTSLLTATATAFAASTVPRKSSTSSFGFRGGGRRVRKRSHQEAPVGHLVSGVGYGRYCQAAPCPNGAHHMVCPAASLVVPPKSRHLSPNLGTG
jgi:hypothetical protein